MGGAADARATSVLLFPTAVIDDEAQADKDRRESRRRSTEEDPAYVRARELDEILSDGVQDLQLRLDISESQERASRVRTELELVELASKRREWVVAPSLERHGGTLLVRIVAVAPGAEVALVRSERLNARELAVRAVVMLRDLLVGRSSSTWGTAGAGPWAASTEPADAARRLTGPVRSEGRAALALNAALLGAFVGYSIQRSSDSEDPRILYPLMALGTGFGLGVSAVIAEEWDIGVGEAWYLSAGAWWPAFGGAMLAGAKSNTGPAEQYEGGLIGAGAGLTLASVALALRRGTTEGGALIAHSGGAFGTFFGGMIEYAVRGSTERDPSVGLGYGAALGAMTGGALALAVRATPSQVILVDLGAGLGALAGAAVTSPFLFKEDKSTNDRVFVIGTMATTVVGGLVGAWYAHRGGAGRAAAPPVLPYATMVGGAPTRDGTTAPGFGFGVQGAF